MSDTPLTSHFSLMPMFPEGFVNQVIVPVCVVIAIAVVAIAVVAIAVITIVAVITVIAVIILIIAVSCMGESFLAQCNECGETVSRVVFLTRVRSDE